MDFNPYHSLIDETRLGILKTNAKNCSKLDGAIAEIGVYHGGSLIRIAKQMPGKVIYGIDTFNGMPKPSEHDLHKEKDFSDVDFGFIQSFLKLNLANIILIKGRFPDEDVINQIKHEKFCFVHVDVDLYKSTYDCLEWFLPKLVAEGILIVDDYGFKTTPGAKKAVDEYTSKLEPGHFRFEALPTGQFWMQRL